MNNNIFRPCSYWEEKLMAFLSEDLSIEDQADLFAHVESCPACKSLLQDYTHMDILVRHSLLADNPLEIATWQAQLKPREGSFDIPVQTVTSEECKSPSKAQAVDAPETAMRRDRSSTSVAVVTKQIMELNKADLAFRLAEWHCQEAQTDTEQRKYANASLRAATQRAFILTWFEKRQIRLEKINGEYVQREFA
jgi:Putative zinc-finger